MLSSPSYSGNFSKGALSYVIKVDDTTILDFRNTVLRQYRAAGRAFPWRETRDPYAVLVSEMMLQQTQTLRVVPKYLSWLSAFPDAKTLADAPLSAVLERWVGLGYNRRAKYLHETCKTVVRDFEGRFPQDPETLETLPGIGPYTARAVSTFAFGMPNAFIETNIRSVFLFFFFPGETGVSDADIRPLLEKTLDREDPRTWYYALMDYGSELKKTVGNPNRVSSHYVKQSKFEGSLRQARGAIVRRIQLKGPVSYGEIAAEEGIDYERVVTAGAALEKEGIISRHGDLYRFP